MGIGQEVHHAIILANRHTLIVSNHSGMELSVGQDDTLGIASSTTGIENIGDVIIGGLSLQLLHLRLSWQVLAQLQEIGEINGIGVVFGNLHQRVEDNDTLQARTE